MSTLLGFFFIIGLTFGALAGLIAFGITFIEWQKHQFTGWKLWKEPLFRGVATFVIFFVISLLLGYFL